MLVVAALSQGMESGGFFAIKSGFRGSCWFLRDKILYPSLSPPNTPVAVSLLIARVSRHCWSVKGLVLFSVKAG